ncbi:DUF502 domain-containing protein [Deferrisoma camini]|uniref:DUF502 domain-containing protein n=1 Tax=Deferrisoma camini TaxID=1035120 RepID=UPI0004AD7546|nr:DUF502 domain-containing protein [Deferrisoma camini]
MGWIGRVIRYVRDRIRRNFIAGFVVIVPLGLTFYVVAAIVHWADRFLELVPQRFLPETYLGFRIPGLGVILTLLFIQVVGFLSANLLGHSVVRTYERVLDRIPVVRTLYQAVKQFLEQLIDARSDRFHRVVLVEYPRKGIYSIGFVTGVSRGEVQNRTPQKVLNVFVPTTPNPTSGYYLLVPEEDAVPLQISVEQAFKLIMSAGMVGWEPLETKARPGGRAASADFIDPATK